RWLEKAEYIVQVATDGEQALRLIQTDCPDFLITDWEMPNMDGLELCNQVRRMNLPHYIFIMFLTVKSASDEMLAGLEIGADEFLCKPVYQEEFLARLRAGSRVLELERRLSSLAHIDPLTGLMTQRTFYDIAWKEWYRSQRNELPMSCVMLDIDYFKRINDLYGHAAGDVVLKRVAQILLRSTRRSDSVCRYGGEEFCVLLPETDESNAAAWAERVRQKIAALSIRTGQKDISVTASFGVSQRYEETQTPEALVDQADQALLCSKRNGRDRIIRFGSLNDAGELESGDTDVFANILAKHVMTPVVLCLREDDTIGQAAEHFLRSRINSSPVVNDQGKLVGILSEKDLMAVMVSFDCWKQPVSSVMRPHVITYEEESSVRTIYEFLCRVSMRRIVIAKDGCPTGTISRSTLLRLFRNLVISRGLLFPHDDKPEKNIDPIHARNRLLETACQLSKEIGQLQDHLQTDNEDVIPSVVGGATGMQDLVNDLLAYSQQISPHEASAVLAQPLYMEGNYAD
ncbi:MAG: diguanylate cyclase, partial [Thermoguttaceae bacterium]